MPIYEYEAIDEAHDCDFCRAGFEQLRRLSDPPLTACPRCSSPIRKKISAPAVGASTSGFDAKAKNAGFSKLKKIGKGEYEKMY